MQNDKVPAMAESFTDIKKLIPHRPPMIMIDGFEKTSKDSGTATKTFSPGDYACEAGLVLPGILVECVAQTVAAHRGWDRLKDRGKDPAMGMLVAIDQFEFFKPVPHDATITITVTKTDEIGPFHLILGELFLSEELAARGKIKIFNTNTDQEHR